MGDRVSLWGLGLVVLALLWATGPARADPRDACGQLSVCCLRGYLDLHGSRVDAGWGFCIQETCGGCPADYREQGAGPDGGACCLRQGQAGDGGCDLVLGFAPCHVCTTGNASCEEQNHPEPYPGRNGQMGCNCDAAPALAWLPVLLPLALARPRRPGR